MNNFKRIFLKKARFSEVMIYRVYRDLSFKFDGKVENSKRRRFRIRKYRRKRHVV